MDPAPDSAQQQIVEKGSRDAGIYFELTANAAEAKKCGVLHQMVELKSSVIKTYRGDVEILESWIEKRPHPDVKEVALKKGLDDKTLTIDHYVLCLRIRKRTPEEGAMGGAWFTGSTEWHGFSRASDEVRASNIWGPVPEAIDLTVVRIEDLNLLSRPIAPSAEQGIVQHFVIEPK